MVSESEFKRRLTKKIAQLFLGCIILVNDPSFNQGFPDVLVLYEDKWAVLEVKKSISAPHRPNQDYWVNLANRMSYGTFVYPENADRILEELKEHFQ